MIGHDAAELSDPLAAGERCRVADRRGGSRKRLVRRLLILVRPPLQNVPPLMPLPDAVKLDG